MRDMFGFMTETEASKIIKNCRFILKQDLKYRDANDDGEYQLLFSCYSGKQFFGATDYKDHRRDTLEQLKSLVMDSLTKGSHQRLHYYRNREEEIPFNKIVVQGYLGGYTAYFID